MKIYFWRIWCSCIIDTTLLGQHPNTKQKQRKERDKPIDQLLTGHESVTNVQMPKRRQRY
jgi:hypothetical protein